jgi:hypothetical protein
MTEEVWALKRENAQLKMALCQANSQLLQAQFEAAKAELAALGEMWVAPAE